MDILSCLADEEQWQRFYEYRTANGRMPPYEQKLLEKFIREKAYLSVVERIRAAEPFPHPKKSAISKLHSEKKRIVYTYPRQENYVLKLLTYLLLRRYDHLFSPNLYSFRADYGVGRAIHAITRTPGIGHLWSYKADVSDYFNSIPVERLLPMVESALADEPEIYRFLARLLTDPLVVEDGKEIPERKGIMAGTPISTFLANLYLSELDARFYREGKIYARYSDDIILFAPTREALDADISRIHSFLAQAGLSMNPAKEAVTAPGEKWVFLGLSYHNGVIDVAPASVDKLKQKMRRKSRALKRWRERKGLRGRDAAIAFIRVFNRKLFDNPAEHELTWARWFFPLITTADSLHELDRYAQSCIRYAATGKHTKAAFDFRYEQMKDLGYISLVNAYYRQKQEETAT